MSKIIDAISAALVPSNIDRMLRINKHQMRILRDVSGYIPKSIAHTFVFGNSGGDGMPMVLTMTMASLWKKKKEKKEEEAAAALPPQRAA